MTKTLSIKDAAFRADGRSRRCTTCPIYPCVTAETEACTQAFTEGFAKGAAYAKQQAKKGGVQ